MGKLPQISGAALVRALKLIKQLQPVGKSMVIVPMHKILKKGTLHGILKDASLSPEKLFRLL